MGALAGQLTGLQNHPLAVIHKTEWMPSWQQEFLDAVSMLEAQIKKLDEATSSLLNLLGLTLTNSDPQHVASARNQKHHWFASCAANLPPLPRVN